VTGNAVNPSLADRRSLLPIYLCCLAFGLQAGTGMPLVPLGLERQGVDHLGIGIVSSAWGVGMLATAHRIPAVAARLGAVPIICLGVLLNAAISVAFAYTEGAVLWFVLSLLSGMVGSVPWVVSEIWINLVVEEKRRGRAVAIYSTLVALGLAAGPLVLQLVGVYGPRPFLVNAALAVLVVLPLLLSWHDAPLIRPIGRGGFAGVLLAAPVALLAALACGLGENVAFSFLPIFALDAGVPAETGATWLTAFVIGNLVLQWPIGWMADHLDRRAVLAGCAAASAGLVALVSAMDAHSDAVLAVLLLWGGISFGIYTVGLAVLGQRFKGGDIARANAAFTMVYTLGGLLGRPIVGAAMDLLGRSGLSASVALFYAAAAAAALVAFQRRG
jgi:MFS family permease